MTDIYTEFSERGYEQYRLLCNEMVNRGFSGSDFSSAFLSYAGILISEALANVLGDPTDSIHILEGFEKMLINHICEIHDSRKA